MKAEAKSYIADFIYKVDIEFYYFYTVTRLRYFTPGMEEYTLISYFFSK